MTATWISRRTVPSGRRALAVKDNIDVVGLPTTAACPAYAYEPERSAPVVERLEDHGWAVAGKTNLDQFATGLVGTRSPYGTPRNPVAPDCVPGGSSSGSAVAVATGEADAALGTDTAGSGRVPAAFCGVVGLKPTFGWLPTTGVVPACASFDCVSVFARDVVTAAEVVRAAGGPPPVAAPVEEVSRFGVPPAALVERWCDERTVREFAAVRASLPAAVVEVDLDAYLAAGELLYGGALVAERHAAVGAFVEARPADVDPVVAEIVTAAGRLTASAFAADLRRLAALRREASAVWGAVDAVIVPTAPHHPTLAEVEADPVGVNLALGRFTNGCNLVGWCAAAVPAGPGVSVLGPAWSDQAIWRAAAAIAGQPCPPAPPSTRLRIAVAGAHMQGQPLNGQLTGRGGRLLTRTVTAPSYRLFALATEPAKPGLVRTHEGDGETIEVEVWDLDPAAFASFVADIPAPLGIGQVALADGTSVSGFLCESYAVVGAMDITAYGGWRAWLASR